MRKEDDMKVLNSNDYALYQVSMGCNVPNKNGNVYDTETLCKYLEDFGKGKVKKMEVDGNYLNIEWEPEITLNYITLDIVLDKPSK
jgi:hypothetical protein